MIKETVQWSTDTQQHQFVAGVRIHSGTQLCDNLVSAAFCGIEGCRINRCIETVIGELVTNNPKAMDPTRIISRFLVPIG
jgi:hypothetical protein